MSKWRNRRRSLALLALNAVVYGTLAATAPLHAETEDGEGLRYIQECACVRIDPNTNQCADWEASGCPWAKIQSCGAGCP